jgi:hypothetical protein
MVPQQTDPYRNFRPGELTRDGFLGDDARSVPAIVAADGDTLLRSGLDPAAAADFLQSLIDAGKTGLGGPVEAGAFTIRVDWARGLVPCPFGEGRLVPKLTAAVFDKTLGREYRFSQLSVHLIREHGFFGGAGSAFRLEPEAVVSWMSASGPER